MKWSVGTKLSLGILVALTLVAAVDVVSHSQLTGLIGAASSLTRTYDILDELDAVLLQLQNAETGQRGYLITGEESYLEPYHDARRLIDADLRRLVTLLQAGTRRAQGDRVARLEMLVADKLAELEETIAVRRGSGFEAARRLVGTDRGKKAMDSIRLVIDEMRTHQAAILRAQRDVVEASARTTIRIIGAGSVLGLVLMVAAGIVIHRDLAARRRAQEEQARLEASLRRSETMSAMGSLVAGVAHGVRNPLFGISSTLDAMEARLGRREEYQGYLQILRGELDRLIKLMRQLLDYGKPPNPRATPTLIDDIIADALEATRSLAKAVDVEVRADMASGLPRVTLDREPLMQVLQNVLENAVQHSPAGGTVTVEARPAARRGRRWVDLAVTDSGQGFQPDDLPQVFEPFFTRRPKGTGLGLAIVHRIVESHGGSISADNRAEGGGLVTVRLPAAENGSTKT